MNIGRLFIPTVLLLAILAITLKIVTTEDIEKVPTDPPTQSEKIDSGKAETNISPFSSTEEIPSTDEGTNITLISPKEGEIPKEFEEFLNQLSDGIIEGQQKNKEVVAIYSAENPPPPLSELNNHNNKLTVVSIATWYNNVSRKNCIEATESFFNLSDSAECKPVIDGLLRDSSETTGLGSVTIGDITPDTISNTSEGISFEMSEENECGTHRYILSYNQLNHETILPFFIASTGKKPLALKLGACSDDGTYITDRSYL